MNTLLSFRKTYALAVFVCLAALTIALLLEHYFNLEPCPLCVLSRIVVIGMAITFFVGLLHNPKKIGAFIYCGILTLQGSIGLGLSIRHLWLQSLPPDQAPACGPSLNYILEALPIMEALNIILKGSGECAQVQWQFLGLSLPGWTATLFTLLIVLAMLPLFRKRAASNSIKKG